MKGSETVRRLHEHRAWVNRRLLHAARSLDDTTLRKPLAIGQGSIWKSLVHMHAAEFVWLECLLGQEAALLPGDVAGKLPGNQEGQGGIQTLGELEARWEALEARWREYLETLTDGALDEKIFKVSSRGGRFEMRRGDILLHVATHAHYTTAQVINMLRQLGATELPDPMLITLAREGAA